MNLQCTLFLKLHVMLQAAIRKAKWCNNAATMLVHWRIYFNKSQLLTAHAQKAGVAILTVQGS